MLHARSVRMTLRRRQRVAGQPAGAPVAGRHPPARCSTLVRICWLLRCGTAVVGTCATRGGHGRCYDAVALLVAVDVALGHVPLLPQLLQQLLVERFALLRAPLQSVSWRCDDAYFVHVHVRLSKAVLHWQTHTGDTNMCDAARRL